MLLLAVLGSTDLELFDMSGINLEFIVNPGDLYGMTMDAQGHIYATVLLSPQIHVFSSEGKALPPIGSKGQGPGEFLYPMALDFHQGYLYTIDNGRGLLYKIDPKTGAVEQEWKVAQANALQVRSNDILVAFNSPKNGRMFGLSRLGEQLDFGDFLYEEPCCIKVRGSKTAGLSFDEDGHFWLAYSGEYQLVKFKDRETLRSISYAPGDFVVPTTLGNVSRFDQKAASRHYTSFDKIRGIFLVGDFVALYRSKSLNTGRLDVYDKSGNPIRVGIPLNNVVPFRAGYQQIHAYRIDEGDNIEIIKIIVKTN